MRRLFGFFCAVILFLTTNSAFSLQIAEPHAPDYAPALIHSSAPNHGLMVQFQDLHKQIDSEYSKLEKKAKLQSQRLNPFLSIQTTWSSLATGEAYQYPYVDNRVSTLTSKILRHRNAKERGGYELLYDRFYFGFYPARSVDKHYGDHNSVSTFFYYHSQQAPLVITMAGLGSQANGHTSLFLADRFHDLGFNVLSMPDAFDWTFGLAVSESAKPGLVSRDAVDMGRLVRAAYEAAQMKYDLKPSRTVVVAYSLGGFRALKMAEQGLSFGQEISKFIILNPPVNLLHGVEVVDDKLKRGGLLGAVEKKDALAKLFATIKYLRSRNILRTDYFANLDWWFDYGDNKTDYAIGTAMTSSVQDTLLMSNEINHLNILKSYFYYGRLLESRGHNVSSYFKELLYPEIEKIALETGRDFDEILANETDIRRWKFSDSLKAKIRIFHNEDDFLIDAKMMKSITKIFPKNSKIYPTGGHLGNLWYSENFSAIAKELQSH